MANKDYVKQQMKTMQSKYIIANLEEQHINEVLRLADVCGLANWTKKDYLEEITSPDGFGFIAYLKNACSPNLVGFIIARLIRTNTLNLEISSSLDETDFRTASNELLNNMADKETGFENECEILNIAVEPASRKKGIGQKMIEETMERCSDEKVKAVWLEVRAGNDAALNFYRNKGFAFIYRRKNYYRQPPDDALVMKKDLF